MSYPTDEIYRIATDLESLERKAEKLGLVELHHMIGVAALAAHEAILPTWPNVPAGVQ